MEKNTNTYKIIQFGEITKNNILYTKDSLKELNELVPVISNLSETKIVGMASNLRVLEDGSVYIDIALTSKGISDKDIRKYFRFSPSGTGNMEAIDGCYKITNFELDSVEMFERNNFAFKFACIVESLVSFIPNIFQSLKHWIEVVKYRRSKDGRAYQSELRRFQNIPTMKNDSTNRKSGKET